MGKYIKNIKSEILCQIFCSTTLSLSIALLAYIPKVFFDLILVEKEMNDIILFIIIFSTLSLISVVFSYFEMIFNWRYAVKFEKLIKRDYFNSIIHYDYMSFNKRSVSDYISIQSNDIMQIEQDYLTPLISAINQIIRVIIFGLVMFLGIDYRIASVVFISSLTATILPRYTGKFTSSKRLKFVNNLSEYINLIHDFFTGFREINLRNTKNIINIHSEQLNSMIDSRYNYGKSKSVSLSLNSLARSVVQILGFSISIILLIQNEISLGTSIATLGFINSFMDPLEEILYCFTTIESTRDVKDKVFNILDNKESFEKEEIKDFNNNLKLNELCSNKGNFQLENISLTFDKNKHYAIIGHNGSGKSTLMDCIMGYSEVNSGKVLIDEDNLLGLELSGLITYITQKPHIFNTNYDNNITMFKSYEDSSDELISNLNLPKELINKIKENKDSTKLSGGEKQIISYIRARNSQNAILIMDEPFSAVDNYSKQKLMDDIASLKDKTIIMIAHDLDKYLHSFDEVIEISEGKVSSVKN